MNGGAIRIQLCQGLKLAIGSSEVPAGKEAANEREPGVGICRRVLESLLGELHGAIETSAGQLEP